MIAVDRKQRILDIAAEVAEHVDDPFRQGQLAAIDDLLHECVIVPPDDGEHECPR